MKGKVFPWEVCKVSQPPAQCSNDGKVSWLKINQCPMLSADDPSDIDSQRGTSFRHPNLKGTLPRSTSDVVSCSHFSWFSFVLCSVSDHWSCISVHRSGPTARRSDVERVFWKFRNWARPARLSVRISLCSLWNPRGRTKSSESPVFQLSHWLSGYTEDDPILVI
jgi:hypothetical protein